MYCHNRGGKKTIKFLHMRYKVTNINVLTKSRNFWIEEAFRPRQELSIVCYSFNSLNVVVMCICKE